MAHLNLFSAPAIASTNLGLCSRSVMSPWTVAHQDPLSTGTPGKNTGMGCHDLHPPLGIFPTQGSNPSLLHLLYAGGVFNTVLIGQ